ncbi:universal stress protein [Alkalimonas amylolytica]|uniref:Nucleotide-binding universal stress protein, UspA family n=1 Tax=Alkalimonas amylolytica TaxID=152573 RepID=A0A1H4CLS4_ALKAM|nr:universal stress protein [Alkalimonas amylolytica]SEA61268.1 Nucleotide-binding universal stress protein, UspA family [Alkalimonas amylolytica]
MIKKVMACIDASPYAEAVCDYSVWAANRLNAPLSMLHILDRAQHTNTPDLSGTIGLGSQEILLEQLAELDEKHAKLALERGRLILDAAKARAEAAGVSEVDERLRHGHFVTSLLELEDEIRLLVLGKRGFSSADAHGQLGLHVEGLIRSMQKPVLLTQQHFVEPKSLLMAFDGSETATKSLNMLAESPLCKGLPCHLVMAGADVEAARVQLEQAAAKLRSEGFEVTVAIVAGEPDVVLNQYQQDHSIGLLVMGAYGHSRIRQFFLGSTTTAMISKAKCSLLVLR